jgi:dipeptidyl-peptidase-4
VEDIYSDPPPTGRLPSAIKWIPDSRGISFLEKTGVDSTEQTRFVIASVPSGKRRIICIPDTIPVPEDLRKEEDDAFKIGGYSWAKTSDRIVFTFKGEIFTMDRKGVPSRITRTETSEENPAFSPDGKKIAFVRDNDIYVIDPANGGEVRLTTSGSDSIINGTLDWVYMEELFTRGKTRAYWWSPDSRKITFLQFKESVVPEFPLASYGSLHGSLDMQHYPKAGDPNPIVRLGVYDLENENLTWLATTEDDDSYIARVYWLKDSNRVAYEKLNRDQNELQLISVDVSSGESKILITETDSTWININYLKHFYEKKPMFVWGSERDGYAHLYLYDYEGRLLGTLTSGKYVVSALNGVDEKRGLIYFTSLEPSPLERHLYRATQRGRRKRITKERGTHNVTMSPDCRYFIDRRSNADTPPRIVVCRSDGRELFTLAESKTDLPERYILPKREFFTFTSQEGTTYHCSMIKPPGFDPSIKYPVLIYVYGGPHAQVVRDAWGGSRYLWHAMMASKGYIVFSMDNRGSYGRGKEWENAIAKRAGILELEDQLAGVEYLRSLSYVDGDRIGIWGWSYGGYMTCSALLRAPHVFKAGAAVAPVTDWRFYDSIYTERYMEKPEDNEAGYDETSLLALADSLEANFFLAHGTTDNNVHMQNSLRLIKKLIESEKDFDLMIYPGKRHGIRGRKERIHLFNKLTRFFEKNL